MAILRYMGYGALVVSAIWFTAIMVGSIRGFNFGGTGGVFGLVIGGGSFLFVGLLFVGMDAAFTSSERQATALKQNGLHAKATILNVKDSGWTVNENPGANLELEIALEGKPTYRVTHSTTVPRLMVGRLVRGGVVPVRVSPTDPHELLIDWDE